MKPVWVVERHINDAAEAIAQTALTLGCQVIRWEEGAPIPNPTDRCIFIGSLTSCPIMPGVIGQPDRLLVSTWHPLVVDIALNSEVHYATVGNIGLVPWETVFVRPDSPMKPFSGRVLARTEVTPAALDCGFYYDDLDLPIVMSPAQQVTQEWRFVSIERRLVASSTYEATSRHSGPPIPPPQGALRLAEEAARRSPEPTVVIDICQTERNEFRLVEYNLFSGADFYACDPKAIVEALMVTSS